MNKLIPTIILLLFITTACTQPPVTEEPTEPTEEITFENATYLRQQNAEFTEAHEKYCSKTYEEENKDEFDSQLLLLLTKDESLRDMAEVCVTENNVYVVLGFEVMGLKIAEWDEETGFIFYNETFGGFKRYFYPEVLNGDHLYEATGWDYMWLWKEYKLDKSDKSVTLIEDCILEPDTPPLRLDCEIQYTP